MSSASPERLSAPVSYLVHRVRLLHDRATDKQAALVLTMTVQQGLATAESIGKEMLKVRRDRRRGLVQAVILDLLGGVRSLGELDVARECRRRRLPEPSRQVVRRGRNGHYYLDVYWDQFRIVVEIEGFHHLLPGVAIADSLRQNQLTLDRDRVLRIPVLGLRVAEAEDGLRVAEAAFLDQVEELLRRHGWQGPPRPQDSPLAS